MRILFYLVVSAHFILVLGVFASFFILPFNSPWFVSLPLCVFIVNLMFARIHCPLTDLENWIRGKLGMPKIKGFVGHYFWGKG